MSFRRPLHGVCSIFFYSGIDSIVGSISSSRWNRLQTVSRKSKPEVEAKIETEIERQVETQIERQVETQIEIKVEIDRS